MPFHRAAIFVFWPAEAIGGLGVVEGYPYCKAEIFRGVKHFDDVFVAAAGKWSVAGGNLTTDGKIGTLTIVSPNTYAYISRSWSFSSATYRYVVVKCTELTGTRWRLELLLDGVIKVYVEYTDTGLKTFDIQGYPYSGDIDEVRLVVYGSGGQLAKFDYIKICEKTVLTPADGSTIFDVIDATVYLAVTEEVGSFNLLLQNWAAAYTDQISVGDLIEIAMTRGTDPFYKVMKARIESVTKMVEASRRGMLHYLRLKGRDLGAELFNRVVTKRYVNQEGSAIVKDVLANFTPLESVGVETTNSTYAEEEYENKPAWEIVKHIAETAKNASNVVGYDLKCEEGDLKFFERQKYTSAVNIDELMELLEFETAIERVRNKIYVYGEASKPFPLDEDEWTESDAYNVRSNLDADAASGQKVVSVVSVSGFAVGNKVQIIDNNGNEENEIASIDAVNNDLTMVNNLSRTYTVAAAGKVLKLPGWVSGTGSGTISRATDQKIKGSYSTKVDVTTADYYGCAILWFSSFTEINCNTYPSLTLQIRAASTYSGDVTIQLEDYAGMVVRREVKIRLGEWNLLQFMCGRKHSDEWTHSLFNTQDFNWEKVRKILVYVHFSGTGTGAFWVDNLFFDKCRWSAVAEDATSQATYGVRELCIIDENLVSTDACQKVADAELKYRKDPAQYLRITVLGDPRIEAGEMIHVVSSNEAINANYRIQSVEHWMNDEGEFESRLTLIAEPPQMAIFVSKTRELLEATKRGTGYKKLGR